MKRILLLLLIIFPFSFSNIFSQEYVFDWVKLTEGPGINVNWAMEVDNEDNVLVSGYFNGPIDFDPGPGVFTLTAASGTQIFLQKLSPEGELIWAISLGTSGSNAGDEIIVDDAGNIFLFGYYSNTCDFDPGPGVFNMTAVGGMESFLLKLDPDGNFLWARSFGGADWDRPDGFSIDPSGNLIVGGYFEGTGDFDPGVGTANLSSAGSYDAFVVKLDPSGNLSWAKSFGGVNYEQLWSVNTDVFGNVYAIGEFQGTADFDPGPGVSNLIAAGGKDMFLLKLDPAGNFVWAKQIGGTADDSGIELNFSESGNLFLTGAIESTVDLDPGPGTFTVTASTVDQDGFVVKLDSSGNFVWGKTWGGSGAVVCHDILIQPDESVVIMGAAFGPVDFDPGPGTYYVDILTGFGDAYALHLDNSGDFIWAKSFGYYGRKIDRDSEGNLIMGFQSKSNGDFDPGPAEFPLVLTTTNGMTISKFKPEAKYISGSVKCKYLSGTDWLIQSELIADTSIGIPENGVLLQYSTTSSGPIDTLIANKSQEKGIGNNLLRVTYSDTFNFDINSGPVLDDHTFALSKCCRSNLDNAAGNSLFYTETALTSFGDAQSLHQSKNLAFFSPTVIERGKAMEFHLNAFDSDADSLAFSSSSLLPVLLPSGPDPLWVAPTGMALDADRRNISWTPSDTGNYAFRMELEEYIKGTGQLRGNTSVEMMVRVVDIPGGNTAPVWQDTASWTRNAQGDFQFGVVAGTTFSLVVEAQDGEGDPLSSVSSGGENNSTTTNTATFTPVIIDDSTIQGTFEWLPDTLDFRDEPYEMTFRVLEEKGPYSLSTDVSILMKVFLGVGIDADIDALESIKVYPNPVVDQVAIELNMNTTQSLELTIMDLQGKVLDRMKTEQLKAGKVVLMKRLDELPQGNYLLKVQGSEGLYSTHQIMVR